jgi:hypothetical protein
MANYYERASEVARPSSGGADGPDRVDRNCDGTNSPGGQFDIFGQRDSPHGWRKGVLPGNHALKLTMEGNGPTESGRPADAPPLNLLRKCELLGNSEGERAKIAGGPMGGIHGNGGARTNYCLREEQVPLNLQLSPLRRCSA